MKFKVVKAPIETLQHDWFEIIKAAKGLRIGSSLKIPLSELNETSHPDPVKSVRNAVHHHLGSSYSVRMRRTEGYVYIVRN